MLLETEQQNQTNNITGNQFILLYILMYFTEQSMIKLGF